MKSNVETISPKKAQKYLDDHWVKERQRIPSQNVVEAYSRSMRAGDWLVTHQGIAIDTKDELIDGVHRLLAIVDSGATVRMMVTTGIRHAAATSGIYAIDAIDRGRERTVGQQLALRSGIKNANMVAATCRGILYLGAHKVTGPPGKFTVSNSLRVLEAYHEEVMFALKNRSLDIRVRNAAVCSAGAFAIKACPERAKEFYIQLASGEGLISGSPAMTCRRWLMNTEHHAGVAVNYRAVLTCAMKHVNQESLTKIHDTEHGLNFFWDKQQGSIKKLTTACGFLS